MLGLIERGENDREKQTHLDMVLTSQRSKVGTVRCKSQLTLTARSSHGTLAIYFYIGISVYSGRSSSASNKDHRPILHVDKIRHASVLLLFVLDSHPDHLQELFIRFSLTHHVPQGYFGVSKETHFQVAISCHSKTIACPAEMVRHGCDEANLTCESRYMVRL